MSESKGVLFVPYKDTLGLLNIEDALHICEQVYAMHARGSVVLSNPPSFKLDVADGFNNHWHVKSVFLKDIPATGVRIYNYFDDGARNTVGGLGCTRFIVLSDPHSGEPVEMDVDLLGAEARIDELDLIAAPRLHGIGRTFIQMQDLEHACLPSR